MITFAGVVGLEKGLVLVSPMTPEVTRRSADLYAPSIYVPVRQLCKRETKTKMHASFQAQDKNTVQADNSSSGSSEFLQM